MISLNSLPEKDMTQQISEQNLRLINKNKAAAVEILTRLSNSLKLETSTQVDRVTYVTRTEKL